MSGTIRTMTADDAEAVARLHIDGWKTAYRGILPDALLDGLDYTSRAQARRKQASDPGNPIANWVLEDEGRVRGWLATGPSRDEDVGPETYELYAIYVAPDDWGCGYGRTLLLHAIEQARATSATEMALWVLQQNAPTRRFYEAAGFAPDARREPEEFMETGATKMRLRLKF